MKQALLLLIIMVCGFSSCTTIEDCQNDSNQNFVRIGFNHSGTVAFDSITSNNIRFSADDEPRSVFVPFLDPAAEQVNYTFYTDSIDFELTLSYQTQLQIFEIDCDPSFRFFSLDTVSHNFDSLVIVNTELSLSNVGADIQIYF